MLSSRMFGEEIATGERAVWLIGGALGRKIARSARFLWAETDVRKTYETRPVWSNNQGELVVVVRLQLETAKGSIVGSKVRPVLVGLVVSIGRHQDCVREDSSISSSPLR
jgi:hypothetical protein